MLSVEQRLLDALQAQDNDRKAFEEEKKELERRLKKSGEDLKAAKDLLLLRDKGLKDAHEKLKERKEQLRKEKEGREADKAALSETISKLRGEIVALRSDAEAWRQEAGRLANQGAGVDEEAVIAEFLKSSRFEGIWMTKAMPAFEEGKSHVCRVAAGLGVRLGDLVEWFKSEQTCEAAKRGHALVPFPAEDLNEIKGMAQHSSWSPPPVVAPNLFSIVEGQGVDFDAAFTLPREASADASKAAVAASPRTEDDPVAKEGAVEEKVDE